jgi:translation initiation factor IF-2
LLASASEAIVIGFNVRPTGNARTIADKEEVDIRNYSIIYDALNDLKDAIEGMLSPELKEEITGTAEIRETFKISKVGTIAGCMVTDGKIFRKSKVRLIRDGIVVTTTELSSLKRFQDDAKEVTKGYDCGMQLKNYNDIKIGDVLECFNELKIKKKLKK